MSNKTLNFIKELESRFGRTGFVEWAGMEAMRLHALFAAMERPEYRERLTAVCPREELKLSANLLKERLKNLYGALEEQIPELKGVFLGQKFERIDEHELYQLIVLFDREGLTGEEYQNEQLVLDFFQALLDELDSTRKEFIFTPDGLIQLMVRALKPVNGIAYDGTAGICNILTALFRHAEAQDGNLKVYGQEIHPEIYVIGKINLFLHGILPEHGDLALGDTIREPKWLENGTVRQFDYVVMNYPFGLKDPDTFFYSERIRPERQIRPFSIISASVPFSRGLRFYHPCPCFPETGRKSGIDRSFWHSCPGGGRPENPGCFVEGRCDRKRHSLALQPVCRHRDSSGSAYFE